MKLLATIALAIAFSCAGAAEPTPDSYSKRFFETLIKGDGSKAIEDFLGSNPLLKGKEQQLQLMKTHLAGALQVYGPPSAAELVLKETLSPSLERRVYITTHDFHPISWEMYFYKGKTGWLPDQLLFVDQYQVLGRKK